MLDFEVKALGSFLDIGNSLQVVIPVSAPSKAWVFGRSLAGVVGSNPAEGVDVSLLRVLCVVR